MLELESILTVTPPSPTPENEAQQRPQGPDAGRGDTSVGSSLARYAAGLVAAAPRRGSVHPANGVRGHRRSPMRIGAGLGDVGRALGAVHRSATTMGRGSYTAHGAERPPTRGVRLLGSRGPHLGVASRHVGVGESGCSSAPAGSFGAPPDAGSSTPCSRRSLSPLSAVGRYGGARFRPRREPVRHRRPTSRHLRTPPA